MREFDLDYRRGKEVASLDFDAEKARFRDYYDAQSVMLHNASRSLASLLTDLLPQLGAVPISKVESRLKDREECVKKFNLKYRAALESNATRYEIRDHISDLVGLRIVCLYEDDVEKIGAILKTEFEVVDVTDKISKIENTESSFGYKGLHFDLKLKNPRLELPEYRAYADLRFEVQVRTIVQDSWSVLDHKIKYKKAIPNHLKRRINTLAALFELADREFKQIRDSTAEEIQKVEDEPAEPADFPEARPIGGQGPGATSEAASVKLGASESKSGGESSSSARLNAFSFLKIASHFFPSFEFEAQKVDGFVQEIVTACPSITRADFNRYMRRCIAIVKRYQADFESTSENRMNPFTLIRHSLYLGDKALFSSILTSQARTNFEAWLDANAREPAN